MQKDSFSRIPATGNWSFVIGSEFHVRNNGDSVQATHGNRIVYISSLRIGTNEMPTPADQIRAIAVKRLGRNERISFVGQSVQGDANIFGLHNKWCLQGVMCADGTMANCVIDFQNLDDRDWAIELWKSLSCEIQAT